MHVWGRVGGSSGVARGCLIGDAVTAAPGSADAHAMLWRSNPRGGPLRPSLPTKLQPLIWNRTPLASSWLPSPLNSIGGMLSGGGRGGEGGGAGDGEGGGNGGDGGGGNGGGGGEGGDGGGFGPGGRGGGGDGQTTSLPCVHLPPSETRVHRRILPSS